MQHETARERTSDASFALTLEFLLPSQPTRHDQPSTDNPVFILLPFLLVRRPDIEHVQKLKHPFLTDRPEGGLVGRRRSSEGGGRRLERVLEEVVLTDRES